MKTKRAVIVQCRLSSSRLPGKALKMLGDKPVLAWVLTSMKKVKADKYFVATQDDFLRNQLRKIPGVPLIFFGQNMLLIDKLSPASLIASERRENLKEAPQKKEQKILNEKKMKLKNF